MPVPFVSCWVSGAACWTSWHLSWFSCVQSPLLTLSTANSLGLIHLAKVFLSDRKQTYFTCIQGSKLNTWHMRVSKVTDLRKELGMGKAWRCRGGLAEPAESLEKWVPHPYYFVVAFFSTQNIPPICLPYGSPPHRLCGYHHPIFIQPKKVSFCMVNIPKY